MTDNQNPEQHARDLIDAQLRVAGWVVQSKSKVNFATGAGVAVREWHTDAGPADYVLFVDRKAVGVIEAKRESEGQHLTVHETQTEGYATAKLKWATTKEPLPFLSEATGAITRFTDGRDPKPRSREIFSFLRPETQNFQIRTLKNKLIFLKPVLSRQQFYVMLSCQICKKIILAE